MTDSATPETGALSVEQAVASLVTPPPVEQDTTPEAPLEAAAEDTEPQGESSAPEEAEDGAETPAEVEETEAEETEAVEPLEPPKYWTQEAKAKFADLPAELQAVVLAQEGPREEAAAKAKAQAAEQVEAAKEQLKGVQTLAEQLASFLPEAIETFKSRWGEKEPDWSEIAEQHGADEAFKLKTRFEAEQKKVHQLAQANQTAQAEAHKAFVQSEWQTLATIAPELAPDAADPTKGADKRQAVTKYLIDQGIPKDAVVQISAKELLIAHKARLYDEAQARLTAAPKPKPAPAPAQRSPVRPAAAPAQSSSQGRAKEAEGRFYQKPSVDNAVALLLSRKA